MQSFVSVDRMSECKCLYGAPKVVDINDWMVMEHVTIKLLLCLSELS